MSIHNILRSLSLVQSLLKDKQTPIWRSRNLGVNYVVKKLTHATAGRGVGPLAVGAGGRLGPVEAERQWARELTRRPFLARVKIIFKYI